MEIRNNRSLTSTQSEISHRKSETEGITPNFKDIEPFEVFDKEMSEISSRNNETINQTVLLGQNDPSELSFDFNNDSSEAANAFETTENHMVGRTEVAAYFEEEIVSHNEEIALPCDSSSNVLHDNTYKSDSGEENSICDGTLIENLSLLEDDDAIPTGPHLQEGLSNSSINATDLMNFDCSNKLTECQSEDIVKIPGKNCVFVEDTEEVYQREAFEEGHASLVNEANDFRVEANCHIPDGSSFSDRDHKDDRI